jgi:hypothetical protein
MSKRFRCLFGEGTYTRVHFNFDSSTPNGNAGGFKGDDSANILVFVLSYRFLAEVSGSHPTCGPDERLTPASCGSWPLPVSKSFRWGEDSFEGSGSLMLA